MDAIRKKMKSLKDETDQLYAIIQRLVVFFMIFLKAFIVLLFSEKLSTRGCFFNSILHTRFGYSYFTRDGSSTMWFFLCFLKLGSGNLTILELSSNAEDYAFIHIGGGLPV
jgi:hypothetical protein